MENLKYSCRHNPQIEKKRVSVLIPTLNSSKTLRQCLDSIVTQDYPHEFLEIIFSDGGSLDITRDIIKEFQLRYPAINIRLVENPLRTGEAGKAQALKFASYEIVAFIDSDNILPQNDWLRKMMEPFFDERVVAAEPIRYTYRHSDPYITRYCALLGMNDPLCYFLGNYDRECVLSRQWTRMPYEVEEDDCNVLKLRLDPDRMPTIGANGFFIRKDELDLLDIKDYLFDIDLMAVILSQDPQKLFSKVRVGIIHLFTGTLKEFYNKQKRRVSDFVYFNKKRQRRYRWQCIDRKGLFYFCFSCLIILPLILQAIKGYLRRRDLCWALHPVLCVMTFYIYVYGSLFNKGMIDRSRWQKQGI